MGKAGAALGLSVAVLLGSCVQQDTPPNAAHGDADTAAQLEALGYLEWAEGEDDLTRFGVLREDPRAGDGVTLYKSRPAPEAQLIDRSGGVLHTWRAPRLDVEDWRSLVALVYRRGSKVSWDHIELLPDGDLLAIVKDRHLERVGWDSSLIWRARIPAHHDVNVAPDGRILTFTQRLGELQTPAGPLPIVDNGIAILSPDGELLREISLAAFLGDRVPAERIRAIRDGDAGLSEISAKDLLNLRDVFHANSIELLSRDVEGLGAAGQALISVRELDLVAVLDLDTLELVWEWGPGEIDRQHHPSLLPNGNVLLFDNGASRGYSRILEVEPGSLQIAWQYRASPPQAFFSRTRGSVQWLPGDHFLISDSNSGRALEIDRSGAVLWEFLNPDIDRFKGKRGAFYRVERLSPERLAALPLRAREGSSGPAGAPTRNRWATSNEGKP